MGRLDGRRSPQFPPALGRGGGRGTSAGSKSGAGGGHCSSNSSSSAMTSWAEWMDQACGVDLLGCDENCGGGRGALSAAALRSLRGDDPCALGDASLAGQVAGSSSSPRDAKNADYVAKHDEFLESLIAEQTKLADSSHSSEDDTLLDESGRPISSRSNSGDTSQQSSSRYNNKQRRRQIRLQKRSSSMSSSKKSTQPSLHSSGGSINTTTKSVEISLDQIAQMQLPPPHTYLHPLCRMQKDKGKGEEVGANICAKGQDACLDKLRVKMRLLTDFVLDPSKGPATMKRKRARISQQYDNFTETRSIIELKMGFLSMTYGVLLRWDTSATGQATLVVLRKMCHDSFYPRDPQRLPLPSSSLHAPRRPLHPRSGGGGMASPSSSSYIRDVMIDAKNALLQRPDGTEVALLEPPYRIPRPPTFDPSFLLARVVYAAGLNRRSLWTIKLAYSGSNDATTTVSVSLGWDETKRCFLPEPTTTTKGGATAVPPFPLLKCPLQSLSPFPLTLRLYEHRLRRRSHQRLVATISVPLSTLEPQPQQSASPVRLLVPCGTGGSDTVDPTSSSSSAVVVALGVALCSDYGYWLHKELEARRNEEASASAAANCVQATGAAAFSWRTPFGKGAGDTSSSKYHECRENDENDDFWDWICCIC